MILKHQFSQASNEELANLAGPLEQNLKLISSTLNVKISRRQDEFKVEGDKVVAERGMEILFALFEQARRPISEEAVQIVLAGDGIAERAEGFSYVGADADGEVVQGADIKLYTRRPDLRARTKNQAQYLHNILNHDLTFGVGPAGTGKTFLAVACAVDALERSHVQRIILTRPAVEAGERLGFLPGDLAQKVDPYLRPLYDALYDLMGFDRVNKAFERGDIEIAPLAFMRGRTLNHAYVILDEAQNTTTEQMKMFLTRIGFGSRAVVNGDASQIDLPKGIKSGLVDALHVLKDVNGIAISRFTSVDVVRHPLVARIVDAYDAQKARDKKVEQDNPQ
ncbi:MAG: PhoH family protein [Saezia sp.]